MEQNGLYGKQFSGIKKGSWLLTNSNFVAVSRLFNKNLIYLFYFLIFPENNEFGEVKPTPVLKQNPQGESD